MKREGRQHGVVLTYQMMPEVVSTKASHRMMASRLDDPPTAGMFSKVSTKPTNHSKFTSRCSRRPGCRGCHEHPVCKSKDKAKGTHKMRNGSGGFGSDLRSVSGSSASGFLDHFDDVGTKDVDFDYDDEDENGLMDDPDIGFGDVKDDDDDDDDDIDKISFCDVGLVWEQVVEDEGWCLVG